MYLRAVRAVLTAYCCSTSNSSVLSLSIDTLANFLGVLILRIGTQVMAVSVYSAFCSVLTASSTWSFSSIFCLMPLEAVRVAYSVFYCTTAISSVTALSKHIGTTILSDSVWLFS